MLSMMRSGAGVGPAALGQSMQFDERTVGEYRIFAGALEGRQGDGYIAALVVQRFKGADAPREVMRDESLACGHRWESAHDALSYALGKAHEAILKRLPAPA